MELTPEILRGAYAYLAETPPFRDWNLPDAEDVRFVVTSAAGIHGQCHTVLEQNGICTFTVDISARRHKYTYSLLQTMAHEMVHVHQRFNKVNRRKEAHGKDFKLLAQEVCDAHGFDPGQF